MTFTIWLEQESACDDGLEFAAARASMQEIWEQCERGDWLIWWLCRAGADRKLLAAAAWAAREYQAKIIREMISWSEVAVLMAARGVVEGAAMLATQDQEAQT